MNDEDKDSLKKSQLDALIVDDMAFVGQKTKYYVSIPV